MEVSVVGKRLGWVGLSRLYVEFGFCGLDLVLVEIVRVLKFQMKLKGIGSSSNSFIFSNGKTKD